MKTCSIIDYFSRPWFALVLILLIGFLAYSNIYQAPFAFDGVLHIEDKAKIRDLSNFLSPRVIFSHRPLVEFTFALNYKFGKLNVFGYHLVNVLIHIINGIIVYFLALNIFKLLINPPAQQLGHSRSPKLKVSRRPEAQAGLKLGAHDIESTTSEVMPTTFQSAIINHQSAIYWMSLFTALIFVAHPVQTQAVTYTAQRYASMAAMFYLLSILFYIKARLLAEGSKLKAQGLGSSSLSAFSFQLSAYFAASLLCSILAFLSKENTASILGVVLLVEYILFDRTWQGWKRKILWFAPTFVLMGVFILYVSGFFKGGVQFGSLLEDVSEIMRDPGTEVGRWVYLCTQFNVLVIYVRLLFLPVGQNLDYIYPFKAGFFDGYTPLSCLFLIAIIGIAIWSIKKRPVITFGILWFFITLSVESSIIPIKDALFEHRLYLPMFGFALIVADMVFSLLPVKRLWRFVVSVLIVISLGSITYMRNRTYQTRITLWSDVISKAPENFRAYYNLGNAMRDHGRLEEAIINYTKALGIKPDFIKAHDNLGVALTESGRLDEAIRNFSEALRIRPRDPMIHSNLGLALMRQGNFQEAIHHFSEALRIRPNYAEAHNNLGIALAQHGNLKDAVEHFSKALRTEPHNAKIHSNLGQAFMLQGKLQEAARHFSEAVRLKPEYAEAHSKLGVVLTRLGDYNGAIGHFSKALQIKPRLGEARKGLKRAFRLRSMKKRL
jgi:Flp pilus assembly protein TadD